LERTENAKRRESLFPLGPSGGKLERSCRGHWRASSRQFLRGEYPAQPFRVDVDGEA